MIEESCYSHPQNPFALAATATTTVNVLPLTGRSCTVRFVVMQTEDQRREGFRKRIQSHLGVVVQEALQLLDAASDQMGKR